MIIHLGRLDKNEPSLTITTDELLLLHAKATPTPWQADIDDGKNWTGKFYAAGEGREGTWCTYGDEPREVDNARYVAAACSAVPALIARIVELEV